MACGCSTGWSLSITRAEGNSRRRHAVRQGLRLAAALLATSTQSPKQQARRLKRLRRNGLAVQVLTRRPLRQAGFTGLLEAARGTTHPPRLVVLRWPGRIATAPLVFVGHGFGLLPAGRPPKIQHLAGDATACAGVMLALALRDSAAPVAAVLALAEAGPLAARPDAEGGLAWQGRLMLADALRYAMQAFRPAAAIGLGWPAIRIPAGPPALASNDAALQAGIYAAAASLGLPLAPQSNAWKVPDPGESGLSAFLSQALSGPVFAPGHAVLDNPARTPLPSPIAWALLDSGGPGGAEAAAWNQGSGLRLLDALVATCFEDADSA